MSDKTTIRFILHENVVEQFRPLLKMYPIARSQLFRIGCLQDSYINQILSSLRFRGWPVYNFQLDISNYEGPLKCGYLITPNDQVENQQASNSALWEVIPLDTFTTTIDLVEFQLYVIHLVAESTGTEPMLLPFPIDHTRILGILRGCTRKTMNRIFTTLSQHYRSTELYRDLLSEILTDPLNSSISVIPYVHKRPRDKINMVKVKLLGGWGNSKSDGRKLKDKYDSITDKPSRKKRKVEEI